MRLERGEPLVRRWWVGRARCGVVLVGLLFVVSACTSDGGDPEARAADSGEARDQREQVSGARMSDGVPFAWPGDCTGPVIGAERTGGDNLLASDPIASWTASPAGQWLEGRISAAGWGSPDDAGSSFVVMHGIDGAVFLWFGPVSNTAGLKLTPVHGVESVEIAPLVPFQLGAYRPAVVDSVVAGEVRLWLLTNPRDRVESPTFTGGAPCLPDQQSLRGVLVDIAAAARAVPYLGSMPATAGRFAINSDMGMSVSDPGDQHLIGVAERVLGRPVKVPGMGAPTLDGRGWIWLYTTIPPLESAANSLEGLAYGIPVPGHRTSVGGLELILRAAEPLIRSATTDVARIADELSRDPFLGQPVAP